MSKLQSKIIELKRRAGAVNYSGLSINQFGQLRKAGEGLLDNRVVEGYVFVWNQRNMHGEKMIKGSCAKSIRERGPGSEAKYKITFLWQHKQDDPMSLFEVLEEDDYGLYFRTYPLDDVASADRTIKQIRSGTLNQFSGGFDYVWDKIDYDETDDSLILKEIDLFEISAVTIGSAPGTYAMRSMETLEDLHDETEDFIKSLPRKIQLEARQLFTRHKSLIDKEPFEQRDRTLVKDEPVATGIDYNFLLNNFKI